MLPILLARHRRRRERSPVALPTFKGKGLRPGLATPPASSTSWTAAVILPDVNVCVYACRFPALARSRCLTRRHPRCHGL